MSGRCRSAFRFPRWTPRETSQLKWAIQDFDQAIRLEPSYARAFKNRRLAYTATGEYDRAIQDLGQVIRLETTNATAWTARCWVRARAGRFAPALAIATRRCACCPCIPTPSRPAPSSI